MPRGIKREPSPDSEIDIKPKKTSNKAAPRPWTADELDTLLSIVLKHGTSVSNFKGQVPNRSGNQCMRTWLWVGSC